MKRLKVLAVIQGSSFGGAHNQVAALRDGLMDHGFDVHAILSAEAGNAFERMSAAGVPVDRMRLRRIRARGVVRNMSFILGFPAQVLALSRRIKSGDYAIVQAHGITNIDVAIATKLAGSALVWQLLDTRAPRVLINILRPLLMLLSDAILVTGPSTLKAHGGAHGLGSRVVNYIPPVRLRSAKVSASGVREALHVESGKLLVACLANFNPQKGQSTLLRAAPAVLASANAAVRIVGDLTDAHSSYFGALEAERQSLKLDPRTLGRLPDGLDPHDFLRAADVVVVPSVSRSEGLPTVIIEAMSLGKPVVASRVGGIPELIADGIDGFLVSPGNSLQLSSTVSFLLENAQARREVGSAANRRARREFPLDGTITAYVKAYHSAVSGNALDRRGRL